MQKGYFFSILILALTISITSFSEPINSDTVKEVAQGFIKKHITDSQNAISKIANATLKSHTIKDITPFKNHVTGKIYGYIVHLSPHGFIALSNDSTLAPVIAYSFNSNLSIDDNPNNNMNLMVKKTFLNQQRFLSMINKETQEKNSDKWISYLEASKDMPLLPVPIEQYPPDKDTGWLETNWGEGTTLMDVLRREYINGHSVSRPIDRGSYNDRCPIIYWKPIARCPAGSVAVAMGQVINYWKYPNSVHFSVDDNYTLIFTNDAFGFPINIKAREVASSWNFDSMGSDNIARLLFACGVACQMQYDSISSFAYLGPDVDLDDEYYPDRDAQWAFLMYFGYASADYMSPIDPDDPASGELGEKYGDYYDPDFYDILEQNMKDGMPAILGIDQGGSTTSTIAAIPARVDDGLTLSKREESEKAEFLSKYKFSLDSKYKKNVILVRFKSTVNPETVKIRRRKATTNNKSVNKLLKSVNAVAIRPVYKDNKNNDPRLNVFRLTYTPKGKLAKILPSLGMKNTLEKLNKHKDIIYAEPNYYGYISATPTDASFSEQWGLQKIYAEYAWDLETGDPNVVIAIVDSGVDYDHPDLADNVWTNPNETADGIDNDNNGFVDDILGWDFVNNDNDPMDDHGHGSHCSGIASAVTNNDSGLSKNIAGTTWNCKIMAVKAASESGLLDATQTANAIKYAADNGAHVISMSFTFYPESATLKTAIDYAFEKGKFLCAAAGNEPWDLESYPAGFPNVIAVAATDQDDKIWDSSAYGTWVDICAPGVDILSTIWDDDYDSWEGTSMACPFVAGAAALVLSQDTSRTNVQIATILKQTADNIDLANPDYVGLLGSGRLNLFQALGGHLLFGPRAVVCDGLKIDGSDKYYHLNFCEGDMNPFPLNESWYLLPDAMPVGYNVIYDGILNIDPFGD
mgnify:CR=1 FL=1